MADLAGQLARITHGAVENPHLTIAHDGFADVAIPYESEARRTPGGAVLVTAWPVEANGRTITAQRRNAWVDDWYHRIHIAPNPVALGNLLTAQVRNVEIWNAWLVPRVLIDVGETDADGIALTAPQDAPTTFGALEARTYTLNIATEGPPAINALFAFAFETETPVLRVTGQRVVVWPFRHNWRQRLLERIGYRTTVITPEFDAEEALELLDAPRRYVEMLHTLEQDACAVADLLLWGWQARVYSVPLWMDVSRLTAAAAAGATTLACSTTDRQFRAGGVAVLLDGVQSEAVEIASVATGSLTLVRPTTGDWSAGATICPALLGRLPASQTVERVTAGVIEMQVGFDIDEAVPIASAAPAVTHQGLPVDLRRPNRIDSLSAQYTRRTHRLDDGIGPVVVDDVSGAPNVVREHRYLLKSRAEVADYRRWLALRRGRARRAWVPSWQADLRVVAAIGDTGQTLTVGAVGIERYWGELVGRRNLCLVHADGTVYVRGVTAVATIVAGEEQLALDAAIGRTVQPGEWARVSWLELTRMESDWHEISHASAEVATASAVLRGVQT